MKRMSSATAVRVWAPVAGSHFASQLPFQTRDWAALAPAIPGTRTVEALVVAEALAIDIGQRQVRQVQIVDAPHGRVGGVALVLALAEEDQFEAVAVTVTGVDVARVIPPLGAEIGVLEVVARKLVAVAGQRLTVRGRRGEQQQQRNLHGQAGHTASVACRGRRRLTCGAGSGTLPVLLPPAERCRVQAPQRESRESRLRQNWWCGCSGRSDC